VSNELLIIREYISVEGDKCVILQDCEKESSRRASWKIEVEGCVKQTSTQGLRTTDCSVKPCSSSASTIRKSEALWRSAEVTGNLVKVCTVKVRFG